MTHSVPPAELLWTCFIVRNVCYSFSPANGVWIFTPYAWFGFKISRSWNGWLWPCTKFLTSLCSTISKVLPQNRIPTPGYISPSVKMLNRESPVPEAETEQQPRDGVSTQPPVTAATLGRWPGWGQVQLWCKLHSYKHHKLHFATGHVFVSNVYMWCKAKGRCSGVSLGYKYYYTPTAKLHSLRYMADPKTLKKSLEIYCLLPLGVVYLCCKRR